MNFDRLAQLISPRTILDIGANKGDWHNQARLRWLDSKFFCIEGNAECEEELQKTGVEYKIAILSDREKEVTFYTRRGSPSCTGASLYRENTPFYEGDNAIENKVNAITLDSIASDRIWDLIKIDTQGAEIDILKGGLKALQKAKWVLMEVSLCEYNEGAPMKDDVYSFMQSKGFKELEQMGNITHPLDPNKIIQQDILFSHED